MRFEKVLDNYLNNTHAESRKELCKKIGETIDFNLINIVKVDAQHITDVYGGDVFKTIGIENNPTIFKEFKQITDNEIYTLTLQDAFEKYTNKNKIFNLEQLFDYFVDEDIDTTNRLKDYTADRLKDEFKEQDYYFLETSYVSDDICLVFISRNLSNVVTVKTSQLYKESVVINLYNLDCEIPTTCFFILNKYTGYISLGVFNNKIFRDNRNVILPCNIDNTFTIAFIVDIDNVFDKSIVANSLVFGRTKVDNHITVGLNIDTYIDNIMKIYEIEMCEEIKEKNLHEFKVHFSMYEKDTLTSLCSIDVPVCEYIDLPLPIYSHSAKFATNRFINEKGDESIYFLYSVYDKFLPMLFTHDKTNNRWDCEFKIFAHGIGNLSNMKYSKLYHDSIHIADIPSDDRSAHETSKLNGINMRHDDILISFYYGIKIIKGNKWNKYGMYNNQCRVGVFMHTKSTLHYYVNDYKTDKLLVRRIYKEKSNCVGYHNGSILQSWGRGTQRLFNFETKNPDLFIYNVISVTRIIDDNINKGITGDTWFIKYLNCESNTIMYCILDYNGNIINLNNYDYIKHSTVKCTTYIDKTVLYFGNHSSSSVTGYLVIDDYENTMNKRIYKDIEEFDIAYDFNTAHYIDSYKQIFDKNSFVEDNLIPITIFEFDNVVFGVFEVNDVNKGLCYAIKIYTCGSFSNTDVLEAIEYDPIKNELLISSYYGKFNLKMDVYSQRKNVNVAYEMIDRYVLLDKMNNKVAAYKILTMHPCGKQQYEIMIDDGIRTMFFDKNTINLYVNDFIDGNQNDPSNVIIEYMSRI